MAHTRTYAHRLSTNLITALDSAHGEVEVAEELKKRYGEPAVREGLLALRELMRELYADLGRRPVAYGIPEAPGTVAQDAGERRGVRRPCEAAPNLLHTLGALGRLRRRGKSYDLEVSCSRLESRCAELRIASAELLLQAFARLGLEAIRPSARGRARLCLRSSRCSHLPLALKLFGEVARLYVTKRSKKQKDDAVPPEVFYRADLRIMKRSDRKVRLPKRTVEDVVPYLAKGQAKVLQELSGQVESLGYQARIKCVDVIGAAWRSSYISPKNGKTLFGFGLDHGGLNLRLSCGDTRRILPYIEKCPTRLRNDLLRGQCARCGGKGCGKEVTVVVDGEEREICHYGIFTVWRPKRSDVRPLKWLLAVQAGMLER